MKTREQPEFSLRHSLSFIPDNVTDVITDLNCMYVAGGTAWEWVKPLTL